MLQLLIVISFIVLSSGCHHYKIRFFKSIFTFVFISWIDLHVTTSTRLLFSLSFPLPILSFLIHISFPFPLILLPFPFLLLINVTSQFHQWLYLSRPSLQISHYFLKLYNDSLKFQLHWSDSLSHRPFFPPMSLLLFLHSIPPLASFPIPPFKLIIPGSQLLCAVQYRGPRTSPTLSRYYTLFSNVHTLSTNSSVLSSASPYSYFPFPIYLKP